MSGLGRICKDCTSLRTWCMIGVRGDVGLRLRISRGGYNCVLGVVYGRRYAYMLGGTYMRFSSCIYVYRLFVMLYLSCLPCTLSPLMLVASYTHTPHVLFIFFLGVLEPRVSLEAASLSLGVEIRCAYIPPSLDPINSFAICGIFGILLGMID
ncbi:hypothetical protein Hanom_Chr13g01200701 [Helianthus anomalus]